MIVDLGIIGIDRVKSIDFYGPVSSDFFTFK